MQSFRGTTKSIMVCLKGQVTVPYFFRPSFLFVYCVANGEKRNLFLLELALLNHDLRLKTIVIKGNIPSRHKKKSVLRATCWKRFANRFRNRSKTFDLLVTI